MRILSKSHRDSQRRIYLSNRIYFITTNTRNRFPYFKEALLGKLLADGITISEALKEFELMACAIMPDHIHLLVKPNASYNISQIMQFIKRHFTRDVNFVMHGVGDP